MKLYSLKPRLKELRKLNDLTQAELAKEMHVHLKTVQNWEQGIVIPPFETIIQLCDLLKCDVDYLIGRIDCQTHDVQFIHDQTGLSEAAVQALLDMNNRRKNESEEYPNDRIILSNLMVEKHLLDALITDKTLLEKLRRSACQIVHNTIEYLYFKSGNYLAITETDGITVHLPNESEYLDRLYSARFIASQAFNSFFENLTQDARFIKIGLFDEDSYASDDEHSNNHIIDYGIKNNILHE